MIRRRVFIAHAAITAAAGLVLVVRPDVIPGAVGITITPDAYLLSYLLAAAEFAVATLSWFGARLTDRAALRAIILTCIVFHAASGVFEAVVWLGHRRAVLLANVAARLVITAGFLWLLRRAGEGGAHSTVP